MKKILAVSFLLVFLLSLGGVPAQAKGQTSFGYISLITPGRADARPVEARARQAFDILAAQLHEARVKGQVVRFEPDFTYGFVKVEYRSGGELAGALAVSPGSLPLVFASARDVLRYNQVWPGRNAPAVQALAATPSFYINLYGTCITAYDLLPSQYYRIYLRNAVGRQVGFAEGTTASDGSVNACFDPDFSAWTSLVPGYTFSIKEFTEAGGTLLDTFTTIIPRFTFTSISVSSKTIKGTAPANSPMHFQISHALLNATQEVSYTQVDLVATKKGAWTVKLDKAVAMSGGDVIDLSLHEDGSNFTFYRSTQTAHIECSLAFYSCASYGIPAASASLSDKHGKKTYSVSGKFSFAGYFQAFFNDANLEPVFLVTGDKVSGTGVKTLTLPAITIAPDYDTNKLVGTAPANRWLSVELEVYNSGSGLWDYDYRWVPVDTTGAFVADFSDTFTITADSWLRISLWYIDPANGNETYLQNIIIP